jgi:hypothetical protein
MVYHFQLLESNGHLKQAQNREAEEREELAQDIAIGYILTDYFRRWKDILNHKFYPVLWTKQFYI